MKRFITLLLVFCTWGCGGKSLTISVTTDGNQTTLLAGLSIKIRADVMHTGGHPGVSWSLSGCASNCGSLSDTTGNSVTYTAPAVVSTSFSVTVVATAAADSSKTASVTLTIQPQACSSGSEATLMGQYAFLLQSGNGTGVLNIVGSFRADGTGRITGGVADVSLPPMPPLTIQANASSYSLGSDHRGCLTLATSDGMIKTFRIAIGGVAGGIATNGRITEFDDASGTGLRAEGILRKQDPSSFTTNSIEGNYVFGSVGVQQSLSRVVDVGVFSALTGLARSGQLDVNRAGTVNPPVDIVGGNINVEASGRGTIGFSASTICDICGGTDGFGMVLQMISSEEMLFISTPGQFPLLAGQIFKQSSNSLDNSSLNATSVVQLIGFKPGNPGPDASVGVAIPDGSGGITVVLDTNSAGTFAPLQSMNGSYVVSSNGRVTTSGLGNVSAILYLIDANRGLVLGLGQSASFGSFEPQQGAPFTNASLAGLFFFGTEVAQPVSGVIGVGSINFDGQGHYIGTEDDWTPMGLSPNQSFTGVPYAFSSAAPQPGRGTLDANGSKLGYIVSQTKLVYISTVAVSPGVVVVEK